MPTSRASDEASRSTEKTPDTLRAERENAQLVQGNMEVDQESTNGDSKAHDQAPDGGFEAWLVAFGAGCIFFCALGFINCFGVFQEYYMAHQLHDNSPNDVSWIGSLTVFLQFATGAIGGPLFDRFGAWLIRPTAVLYIFAVMMLSLCTQYWHFMLTQGVLMGLTTGLMQFPVSAAVSQYFEKKRASALGIVISGSSIGGIILPIAVSKMLNNSNIGFGWSIRIMGFIMLPLMAIACVVVKGRLPPRRTEFFIGAAFKDPTYGFLIIGLFFQICGMFTPLFYMPTYAVSRGMNATLSSYLLAILNAASTFGRIIPGILADKFGRLNIFALGGIITGVIIFCMDSVKSNAALIVYSVVVGFWSGTIISGGTTAISFCSKDPRNIGTFLGQGLAVASLSCLVGPPVSGKLLAVYGGFFQVSIFSGAMAVFGGLVAFATKTTTPEGILGRV